MKTRLVLTMALYPWLTQAQVSFTNTPIASLDTPPVVVETGPHHRVWRTGIVDEHGRTNVSSFTELATGLNFFDPATRRYEESQEAFTITADGHAVALKGQHRVAISPALNDSNQTICSLETALTTFRVTLPSAEPIQPLNQEL